MAVISNIYISVDKLKVMLDTVTKRNEKGISLDVTMNDEVNEYGQNVSVSVGQTKEQRDAKTKRYYVGNGKVIWTDNKITVAPKQEAKGKTTQQPVPADESDSLPF